MAGKNGDLSSLITKDVKKYNRPWFVCVSFLETSRKSVCQIRRND
jgi:hypothetical protein